MCDSKGTGTSMRTGSSPVSSDSYDLSTFCCSAWHWEVPYPKLPFCWPRFLVLTLSVYVLGRGGGDPVLVELCFSHAVWAVPWLVSTLPIVFLCT